MNHKRNAMRLAIVFYWTIVLGLLFGVYSNQNNFSSLGWSTWLTYIVTFVVAIYAGVALTKTFWSTK